MIKVVTSITVFGDAVGKRLSASYSEVDETTGKIITDNKRIDRVITDKTVKNIVDELTEYAQQFIEET